MTVREDPRIGDGTCHIFFAFDVGASIDLENCALRLGSAPSRKRLVPRHPGPTAAAYRSSPLSLAQAVPALAVGAWRTEPEVELLLHDFGVVSLAYRLPIAGPLEALVDLGCELYDHEGLRDDSRRRVEALLQEIRSSVTRPALFDESEDYVVYEIAQIGPPAPVDRLANEHAQLIARILRAERAQLSEEEIADAHACRIAYGVDDLAILDWNAAMLLDRDAYDVRAVLEFANLELLELRVLDRQLDEALTASHAALRQPLPWLRWPSVGNRGAGRVAQLQVEGAILFEEINNSLKLLGDQHLARVYRLTSQRFHLNDWDAAVRRKLDTLESIYQKLADRRSSSRMEFLEWIIILLIAVSIALPFLIS
jgi:hypothetical protein